MQTDYQVCTLFQAPLCKLEQDTSSGWKNYHKVPSLGRITTKGQQWVKCRLYFSPNSCPLSMASLCRKLIAQASLGPCWVPDTIYWTCSLRLSLQCTWATGCLLTWVLTALMTIELHCPFNIKYGHMSIQKHFILWATVQPSVFL